MTKFKVGDKVRVTVNDEFVPKGTLLTVTKGPVGDARGGNYYFEGYPQTDNYCVLGGDLALAFEKSTKNQRITTLEQNVVSLESEVAELKAKVEALEALPKPTEVAEMFALAQLEAQIKANERSPKRVKPKSPNEQRKAIIAEAKAFINEVKTDVSGIVAEGMPGVGTQATLKSVYIPTYEGFRTASKAEFYVNKDKRTVTVLLKGVITGNLYAKGIAKCAPDDVFNADIGKAIALGRALGLDVSRFEQAVKPTVAVVGMKAEVRGIFDYYVNTIKDGRGFCHSLEAVTREDKNRLIAILDDTEAVY